MAVISNVTFRADANTLRSKASEVLTACDTVEKEFKKIETIIKNTNNYWVGTAAEEHRKVYNNYKDDIAAIIKRVKEHPKDLNLIAANYDSAESNNVQQSSLLTGSVLE